MIPQSQIDEIIEKNDIVSVVSEYVKLERKGNSFKGLCPFHKEKTPSFSVHEDRQIFKCFGCGKGGNVVHFIMAAESLNYVDAIKFLAERVGVTVRDTYDKNAEAKAANRKKISEMNKLAGRFYFDTLNKSREGFEYFNGRGVSPDMVKKFGLGFAPDAWDSLINHMKEKGYDENDLFTADLVVKNRSGGYCDKFRHKIMFPIFDVLGNVVAFGGRVLDDSKPKYVNTGATDLYTKGKHLYGLNFARQSGSKKVIVVEGYMDCIALHQRGITWTVAAQGTALTIDQARLLKKYFDDVVTCFDADAAGESATIRGMDILAKEGFSVRVMSVPDGKDPDEYLKKHSSDEFISLTENAPTLVEYKIMYARKKFSANDNGTRAKFLNEVTNILAKIESAAERDMYVKWTADKYRIAGESLKEQVEIVAAGGKIKTENIFLKRVAKNEDENYNTNGEKNKEEIRIDKLEKTLILLCAEDKKCFQKIREKIGNDFFKNNNNKELFERLCERYDAGDEVSKEVMLSESKEVEEASTLAGILEGWITPEDPMLAANEVVANLKKIFGETRMKQIYTLLSQENLDKAEKDKLQSELKQIILERGNNYGNSKKGSG